MNVRYFLLMLLLGFCSCYKDKSKPHPPVNRLIPAELRAYWDFKPGTYWIYEDSISGLVDTVTVTSRYTDTFESPLSFNPDIIATCEALSFDSEGSSGVGNQYGMNTAFTGPNVPHDYNNVRRTKTDSFGYAGVNACFVYPLTIGNRAFFTAGFGWDTCEVKEKWSTAFGFDDVVLMRQSNNTLDDYQITLTYFAKNIGIIRKEYLEDSAVYKLIDYHIE